MTRLDPHEPVTFAEEYSGDVVPVDDMPEWSPVATEEELQCRRAYLWQQMTAHRRSGRGDLAAVYEASLELCRDNLTRVQLLQAADDLSEEQARRELAALPHNAHEPTQPGHEVLTVSGPRERLREVLGLLAVVGWGKR